MDNNWNHNNYIRIILYCNQKPSEFLLWEKVKIMEDNTNYLDSGLELPKTNLVKVDEEIDLLYETLERIGC